MTNTSHVDLTRSTADRFAAATRRVESGYVPSTRGGSPWTPAASRGESGGVGFQRYQVLQMVTDAVSGWDFVRASP